jgi:hypothetical protein
MLLKRAPYLGILIGEYTKPGPLLKRVHVAVPDQETHKTHTG